MMPYNIPDSINYIGVFLTFKCSAGCPYCINRFRELKSGKELEPKEWALGLGRIVTREDLPITFQGGEPTQYNGWWKIAAALYMKKIHTDILTNGMCDVRTILEIPTRVFKRDAKYASIRVSYHPGVHNAVALATKVWELQTKGYHIGIWGLDHPDNRECNEEMAKICKVYNIDFRMKEFLGEYKGKWYGTMKYPMACNGKILSTVSCKTTEMVISPSGDIHRCHSDLYMGINKIGHILDDKLPDIGQWKECRRYGMCNPCDIKVKTNRLQEYGHTSVEIKGA